MAYKYGINDSVKGVACFFQGWAYYWKTCMIYVHVWQWMRKTYVDWNTEQCRCISVLPCILTNRLATGIWWWHRWWTPGPSRWATQCSQWSRALTPSARPDSLPWKGRAPHHHLHTSESKGGGILHLHVSHTLMYFRVSCRLSCIKLVENWP